MKKIDGIHAEYFDHLKNKHAIAEPPEKLFPVSEGETFEVKSGYYDIDLNRHVTTTRYMDWMMDTMPLGYHEKHYPQRLSLNIMKETMPGETILVKRKHNNDLSFQFEGFNLNNDTNAFRASIEF
jgi:medium-chain acyl-[acyl-carrier-protein] hydrolase